ncbi:Transmembrane 9 superfamily member 4 [Micractinium conductrix]|uniref:Transmembrane 9 superfamily member n=1 Tax=Micractinium conductrix TaxID=554055 RepID=A0A2P6VPF3_9CHLO|nr:Transmembrane 9 superfamily member 4 [Micractinium conductrix]|eukprot:PSC75978.1 Transmembrane 9 superfamily member 4 [Micractinium conductrix]
MRPSAVCVALLVACLALGCAPSGVRAWYLPGTYPVEFLQGDVIQAEVNSLVSSETEMPIGYYSMPFCKPAEGVHRSTSTINPGTILLGVRIENSPYNFTIMTKQQGLTVCNGDEYPDNAFPALNPKQVKLLQDKIRQQYRVRLILDNLPITTYDLELDPESVRPGYEIGFHTEDDKYYVNNHLMFKVLVHETNGQYTMSRQTAEELDAAAGASGRRLLEKEEKKGGKAKGEAKEAPKNARAKKQAAKLTRGKPQLQDRPFVPGQKMYMIVGFEVVACSIKRKPGAPIDKSLMCPQSLDDPNAPEPQEVKKGSEIVYTYDVYWDTSDITWSSRWDAYLRMPGGKVHWFSILNSLMVVVVMSCIVAMIMMRTIRRDLQRYEQLLVDGGQGQDVEESGWKMVSGDVFRAPSSPLSLCVQIGSGVQILASGFITLLFAALGFLSPASRGSLLTGALVMYLLLSVAAGYAAVWLWGLVNRSYEGWFKVCWRVACFFPGVTVGVMTFVNIFLWATKSSGAIPLGFFFSIIFLWLLISIPLSYAGGIVAAKQEIRQYPTRTNQIPRHIPPPHWASHPLVLFFAAGLLPFGTIFVELYFAMTSMWQGYFYYIFGFAFLVSILTMIITIEVSIVCTYVQLCAEDYLWWWRSYYRGGSISIYVLIYSIGFLVNTLHKLTGFIPIVLYLSYMGLAVWCLFLAMGTIGFLSSFLFTYAIFNAAKSD